MSNSKFECWGKTYIDFEGNFSVKRPKRFAVIYCYFEKKEHSSEYSGKDGTLVTLASGATKKDINDIAAIVNSSREKHKTEKIGVNYNVLENLKQELSKSDVITKRRFEFYRKKQD